MRPVAGGPLPPNPFAETEAALFAARSGAMRVNGIRRCGQHAVINWILRNCGTEDTVFLNSCTLRRSAMKTCGQSEINGVQSKNGYKLKKMLEPALESGTKPFILLSYEAGLPEGIFRSNELTQGIPNDSFDHDVLVIRSFVNWLPSFIRLMRVMNRHEPPTSALISNGIAFEIWRYKDHMKAAKTLKEQVVTVSYDDWFLHAQYRRDKLRELGLSEIDNSLGEVQIYGAGSSFTGHELPASDLDIANRWRTMQDDPYAKVFVQMAKHDTELMALIAEFYPADLKVIDQLTAAYI